MVQLKKIINLMNETILIIIEMVLIFSGYFFGIVGIVSILFIFLFKNPLDIVVFVSSIFIYFLHYLKKRKNPELFNLQDRRMISEIIYFGYAFASVVIIISIIANFFPLSKDSFTIGSLIGIYDSFMDRIAPMLFYSFLMIALFIFIFISVSFFFGKIISKFVEKNKKLIWIFVVIVVFFIPMVVFFVKVNDIFMDTLERTAFLRKMVNYIIGIPLFFFLKFLFYGHSFYGKKIIKKI